MRFKKASLVAASVALSISSLGAATVDWNGRQSEYSVVYENGVPIVKDGLGNAITAGVNTAVVPAGGGSGVWDALSQNWVSGGRATSFSAAVGNSTSGSTMNFGGTGGLVLVSSGLDVGGTLNFNAGGYELVAADSAPLRFGSINGNVGSNKVHNAFGSGISVAKNATVELVADISGTIGSLTGSGNFTKSGGGLVQFNGHQGDGVYKNATRPTASWWDVGNDGIIFIDFLDALTASSSPGGRPAYLEGNPETRTGGVVGATGTLTGVVTVNQGVLKVGGYLNQWKEYSSSLRESKFDVAHMQGAERVVLNGTGELAFANSPLNVADDVAGAFGGSGGTLVRRYNFVQNLSAGLNHDQFNTRLDAGTDSSYRIVLNVDAAVDTYTYARWTVDPQYNTLVKAAGLLVGNVLPAGTVMPRSTQLPAGFDMNNVDLTFTTGIRIKNPTTLTAAFTLPAGTYFERGTTLLVNNINTTALTDGGIYILNADMQGTTYRSNAERQSTVGSLGILAGKGDIIKTGKGELRVIGDAERGTGRFMISGGRVVLSSVTGNALANVTSVNLAGTDSLQGRSTRPDFVDPSKAGDPTVWREGVVAAPEAADLVLQTSQRLNNFQADFAFSSAATDAGSTVLSAISNAANVDNRAEGLIAGTGLGSRIFLNGKTLTLYQARDGIYRGSIFDKYNTDSNNSLTPDLVEAPTGSIVKMGAGTLALLLEYSHFKGVKVVEGRLIANAQGLGTGEVELAGGELSIIQLNTGTLHALLKGAGVITIGTKATISNGSATPLQINSGNEVGILQVGRAQTLFSGEIAVKDGVGLHFTSAANDALLNVTAISLTGGDASRGSTLSLGDSVQHLSNLSGDANARIDLDRGTLFLKQSVDGGFAGSISGAGSLVKQGSASFVIDGSKTQYYGATVVQSGRLQIVGENALTRSSGLVLGAGAVFDGGDRNQGVGALFGEAGSIVEMGSGTLTVGLNPSRESLLIKELAGGKPLSSNYLTTQGTVNFNGLNYGPLNFDTTSAGNAPASDPQNLFRLSDSLAAPLTLTVDTTFSTGVGLPPGALPSSLQLSKGLSLSTSVTLGGDTNLGGAATTLTNGATLSGAALSTAITLNNGGRLTSAAFGSSFTNNRAIFLSSSPLPAAWTTPGAVTLGSGTLTADFVTPAPVRGNAFTLNPVAFELPAGTVLQAPIFNQNGDIIIPAGPLGANTTIPVNSQTWAAFDIPAGATLKEGSMLPSGGTLDAGALLPAGTILPGGSSLAEGSLITAGTRLPEGSILAAGNALPAGTRLPAGSVLAAGTVIAANGVLPAGTTIAQGTTLAAGVNLPAGTVLGADIMLPNGSVLLSNTILPAGTQLAGNMAAATRRFLLNVAGFSQANAEALAFAGSIRGSGGLTKIGADTLILTGVNTYTGATQVQGGSLIANYDAISSTSGVSVSSGALFGLNIDQGLKGAFDRRIAGNGVLQKLGAGDLSLSGDITGFTGSTLVSAGTLRMQLHEALGSIDIASGATLAVNQIKDIRIASSLSGAGKLEKSGAGVLTLSNAGGFSGEVVVSAGTVAMNTLPAGNITIAKNAAFEGALPGAVDYSGVVSGSGALRLTGGATTFRSGNAGFDGTLSGVDTRLVAGVDDVFSAAELSLTRSVFDLNGTAQSFRALSGDRDSSVELAGGSIHFSPAASVATEFAGQLTGDGALVKDGEGKLSLTSTQSSFWTGFTTVNAGELETTPEALGASVVHLAGGVLALRNADAAVSKTYANLITGAGALAKTGSGEIVLTAGAAGVTGGVFVREGRLTTDDAGTDAVFSTVNTLRGSTFQVNMSGDRVHDASSANRVTGTGNLAVSGTYTLKLVGVQSYSGVTELLDGARLDLTAVNTVNGLAGDSTSTVLLPAALTVVQSDSGVFAGSFSGDAALRVTGSGRLAIAGDLSGLGAVTVDGGNLQVGTTSKDIALTNGGTVYIAPGSYTGVVSGNGDIVKTGGGVLDLSAAVNFVNFGKLGVDEGVLIVNPVALPSNITGLRTQGAGELLVQTQSDTLVQAGSPLASISGDGVLAKTGAGKLSLGTKAAPATLAHTGVLQVREGVLGGNFKTAGSIAVLSGATLAPGNSIGTVVAAGNFVNSGTLAIELSGVTSDKVIVSGAATLGGTLAVSQFGPDGPVRGTRYAFLTASSVTGDFASVQNNLPAAAGVTGIWVEKTATGVNLVPVQSLSAATGFTPHDGLGGLLAQLDARTAPSTTTGYITDTLGLALVQTPNDSLAAVVNTLSPLGFASEYAMAQDGENQRQALLHDRLEQRRYDRGSPLSTEDAPWEAFVVGGGTFVTNDDATDTATFDYRNFGGMVGLDRKAGDDLLVGAAVGYQTGKATIKDNGGKVDMDRAAGTLFLSTQLTKRWYLDLGATAGVGLYESRRTTVLGAAEGDNTGYSAGFNAETGTVVVLSKELHLTPYLSAAYTHHEFGSISETGSAAALNVDSWSQDSLRAKVGTGLSWFVPMEWVKLKVGLDVAFAHELLDTDSELDARFATPGSPKFSTTAAAIPQDAISLTPNLGLQFDESTSATVSYTYEMGLDARSYQSVNFAIRKRF